MMRWIPFATCPRVPQAGRYLLGSANVPGQEAVASEPMTLAPESSLEDIDAFAHGRVPYPMMLAPEQRVTHFCLMEAPHGNLPRG